MRGTHTEEDWREKDRQTQLGTVVRKIFFKTQKISCILTLKPTRIVLKKSFLSLHNKKIIRRDKQYLYSPLETNIMARLTKHGLFLFLTMSFAEEINGTF